MMVWGYMYAQRLPIFIFFPGVYLVQFMYSLEWQMMQPSEAGDGVENCLLECGNIILERSEQC